MKFPASIEKIAGKTIFKLKRDKLGCVEGPKKVSVEEGYVQKFCIG